MFLKDFKSSHLSSSIMNLARSFWLGVAEAYLEPSQTSTKGRFYEKVFAKKFHRRCSTGL